MNNISLVKQIQKSKELTEKLVNSTSFLEEFYEPTFKQRMFHFVHDIQETVKCKNCGNPSTWNKFDAVNYVNLYYPSKNYQEYCDKTECQSVKNKLRMKAQCERKGVQNLSQLPKWKETKVKNCQEKYGVDWFNQTTEYKEKLKLNSLEKYGVEHYTQTKSVQEKKKQTNLLKYGVEHVSQSNTVQEKIKKSCIKKYGVDHPLKIAGELEKRQRAGYKWKEYVFPSGKIIKVQGYEDKAIDQLLKIYNEEDIVTDSREIEKHVGKIMYEHDGKTHRYFPDLYIKSEQLLIEVKSLWTFETQKKLNLLKADAAKKTSNFQFLIIDPSNI